MERFPQLLFVLTAREDSHLVASPSAPPPAPPPASSADGCAGVSADAQTGAPRGRFSGATAVIPDRR
jgi:hypothetical protein